MVNLRAARRLCAVVMLSLLMSACATYRHATTLQDGAGADFVPSEISAHRIAQDRVLAELYGLANVTAPPLGSADWDVVVAAGMDYADRKCEAYMHALFRLNRDKKTVVSELGLLGTATAGIMAAAKAAAKEVAMVAIAYGLAASTIDNLSSNLLYELDPSSVRTMVKALQGRYRQSLGTGYVSRPGAANAIRGYALLCVPASIEAEVNLSIKKAQPEVAVKADPARNRAPQVTNAAITIDQSFQGDDSSELLRNLVFPRGAVDDAGRRRLEAYLVARGIGVSVVSFINGAAFTQERARAARFLDLAK